MAVLTFLFWLLFARFAASTMAVAVLVAAENSKRTVGLTLAILVAHALLATPRMFVKDQDYEVPMSS